MQCLHFWFTIGLCAISVNNLLASPVNTILSADDKSTVDDLSTAGSDQQDGAEVIERDNEVGYLRKSNEKGGDGYQHFESYHDKDGGAYGYEKHEAFGKSDKGETLNGEKDKDKDEGSHYTYVQELGDKPKYQKYHSGSDDPGKNKQTNYHYSYSSDDDDEEKPERSSNYKEDDTKSDISENNDEGEESGRIEEGVEEENDGTDEEKSTNFRYKLFTDDYAEDGANDSGDVNSKGNGNGYNFGHGNKNTDVDYSKNSKKSDYTAKEADESEDDEEDEDDDEDGEEEAGEAGGAVEKETTGKVDANINSDKGKDKNNYSSYTSYTSQEGDEVDDENDEIPKNAIRYQIPHPTKLASIQAVKEEDDNEEEVEEESVEAEDVEVKPTPAKPIIIVHVQPTKPVALEVVQEHRAAYTVEHKDGGDDESDDSGKAKADGGNDGGDSGDAGGDDKGQSEKLTKPNKKSAEQHPGGYEVNINYGEKQNSPKNNGDVSTGKKKSILKKKKKIVRPHTYEVEEYIDGDEGKKAQLNAGKGSAPQHHRDNGDYSYGQQFIYASEADSDAYYW